MKRHPRSPLIRRAVCHFQACTSARKDTRYLPLPNTRVRCRFLQAKPCRKAAASSTTHFCDILHGSIPKSARCCRALGSITGPRASGSWTTPVPSSSHPRCTRGEVRGRSRKAQVLTRDGDESCRPLQVRQRERHGVYRRGVRPYQQVQCVPNISTSPPCTSWGTSYQHQERDRRELGAVLAEQLS